MSRQIIILLGGEDVKKRTNEPLIRKVGELSTAKKILVIPWSSGSDKREQEYRSVFRRYFSDSGFIQVLFLEKDDQDSVMSEKFASVDVVYLPGGDPGVLYEELKKRNVQDRLRGFRGIIIGNSAGAIVLSAGAVVEDKFYPGFGLVRFFVSVHYTPGPVSEAEGEMTVNIPGGMWIAVSGSSGI
ncbi:MAG: Type 1 glutamine amidotransferase-like domain-containing protein [Nitrososphaeria archaeon]